jgi:hypothetical protein
MSLSLKSVNRGSKLLQWSGYIKGLYKTRILTRALEGNRLIGCYKTGQQLFSLLGYNAV